MPRTREEARTSGLPKRNTVGRSVVPDSKRSRPNVVPVESSTSDSDSDSITSSVNVSSDSSHDSDDDEVQSSSAGFTLSDSTVFNCSLCTLPLSIPVYQCEDGHFICPKCCGENVGCSACGGLIGDKRCRGIEKVIESIKTSCKNKEQGCTKKMSYCLKLVHENSCKYTPFQCPRVGCNYIGVGKSFYDHYAEKHPDFCKLIKLNSVNSINVGDELYLLLEEKTKRVFFLNRVVDPLGSFVNVSTIPTASNIQFAYELTVDSGLSSVNMRSLVEITPKYFAKPAKEKCLLISNIIHSGADHRSLSFPLQLVIKKVRL